MLATKKQLFQLSNVQLDFFLHYCGFLHLFTMQIYLNNENISEKPH